MSDEIIEEIADLILDACNKPDEVEAIISNVLVLIAEQLDDEEWQPTIKDLRQVVLDSRDDDLTALDSDLEDEELEVIKHPDGFVSLK
mgnify:CR=1 FL=1